ncbi:hypothetical protein J437_LFUL004135 [Ladona fulva]|uniref:Otopetrin-2 n=1 Tax=Ladona fulva TaxID=123851 RepID=A0A8K0K0K5_LADFU|nr:hypothetical protein J437_LFUL004135 [Ladona fulva]
MERPEGRAMVVLPRARSMQGRSLSLPFLEAATTDDYDDYRLPDSLATIFSAIYGKLLVVLGIAFPMAEVISTIVPPALHEGFYLYLYLGSMLFLLYLCAAQLRPSSDCSKETGSKTRYGSFYLRMGAVAFGIGSMIYSGLEFGLFFEMEKNPKCHNILLAVTPATRMAFIIVQMQFIFLKNKQIEYPQHKLAVRFVSIAWSGNSSSDLAVRRNQDLYECRRTNIMGSLVQNASPFLFPCTIEYSLICAVILYAMWRTSCSGPPSSSPQRPPRAMPSPRPDIVATSSQHFSVDCASAHRGLFSGILVLVLTIISLIMFLVLEREPDFAQFAILEVNAVEVSLYVLTTLATLWCAFRVRVLRHRPGGRHMALDCILLVIAQTGLYLYAMFSIIAGYFSVESTPVSRASILVSAVVSLVQTTCQTVFVLDAWWRRCSTAAQARSKPGRQIVTFLLVTNMAMWTINRLQNSRADFHPLELAFYGKWAWTIITHVSMPLAIFYRFHSTVCLCEIWKSAYKVRLGLQKE